MAISCKERLEKEAALLALVDPDDTGAISRIIQRRTLENTNSTWKQKLMEVYYNSILSGIPTQVTVVMETALTNMTNLVERGLASGVGLARQTLTGKLDSTERYTFGDVAERAKGMFKSVNDKDLGAIKSTQELVSIWYKNFTNPNPDNSMHPVSHAIGTDTNSPKITQIMGKILRTPSAAITGTDAMMQEVGKRGSLYEQASIAFRRAEKAGETKGMSEKEYIKDFVDNPNKFSMTARQIQGAEASWDKLNAKGLATLTKDEYVHEFGQSLAMERARLEGKKANFTSKPGAFTSAVIGAIDTLDKHLPFPFTRMLIPFVNTPANIFKWVFERVPGLNLMFKDAQRELTGGATFGELIKRVPKDQRSAIREYSGMDFDNVVARTIFGGSVLAAAMYLEASGKISAGPVIDPEKRTTQLEAGNEPYSYRILNKMLKYTRPDAIGLLIGLGADLNRLARYMISADDDTKATYENVVRAASTMVGYNLVEKTWASNLGLFVQAATDWDRYGKRFTQQMLGSPIPTIVRNFNDAIDPEQHQMLSIVDALMNKSGLGRSSLFQAYNISGDPKHIAQPVGPLGNIEPTDPLSKVYDFTVRMVSPYRGTDLSQNPVMRAMASVGMPTKKVSEELKLFPDVKDDLTEEQYNYYARNKGQILSTYGNQLIQNVPNFDSLPDAQRKIILGTINSEATKYAKALLIAEYPYIYKSQADRYMEKLKQVRQPYSEPVFNK